MKLTAFRTGLLVIIFLVLPFRGYAHSRSADFFTSGRLRIDFIISGDWQTGTLSFDKFMREADWGGNPFNLIDTFRYGEMMVEVYDSLSGAMIFSRGFSTLFQEWQTTDEAKTAFREFYETVLIPFPAQPVRIDLLVRNGAVFERKLSLNFNPVATRLTDSKSPGESEKMVIRESGHFSEKLDIILLSEGYAVGEKEKYYRTAQTLVSGFLEYEPYRCLAAHINIYALFIPSQDTGITDPVAFKYLSTPLHCSFNTFGSDRYITSCQPRKIFDYVSQIPFDQLVILVNTEKYGGGAIYNHYTFLSAENEWAEFLMMHEFGHAFAGLADEYFTSSVAYQDYFDVSIEPYQPNITTLVDFSRKWADLIPDTIPVPTADSSVYDNITGVYEGAGYSAKGIYRPYRTCIMKAKSAIFFCPVCRKAISDMLLFYSSPNQDKSIP